MDASDRAQKAFRYVLSVFFGEDFEAHCPEGKIRYTVPEMKTEKDEAAVYIIPSGFFGADYGKSASLPHLPCKELEGVPILYGQGEVHREGNRLIVYGDIIASAFFLLTRYEEWVRPEIRDEHGRFIGRESVAYRGGFLDRSIVDEYATKLRQWLREVGVNMQEPRGGFSVLITHDVDRIRKFPNPLKMAIRFLLGKQSCRDLAKSMLCSVNLQKDPFDTFDQLLTWDSTVLQNSDVPAKVIYFLMAGGNAQYDNRYRIGSPKLKKIIKNIRDSGASIGLHSSYEAGLHPETIINEKKTLESVLAAPVTMNRHHYLGWRKIEDGHFLAKAGIEWDSTLGFADLAGFRMGTCQPFELFDPIHFEKIGVVEHPLILMDCSLSHHEYMAYNEEQALEYAIKLIKTVKTHKGEFVMLWHNSIFESLPGNYHPSLYPKVLKKLISS